MSESCAVTKCDRTSRALCDCCEQNLCLQHLHEHNSILVSKLNPLTDEINALGDRLNRLNIEETLGDCRQKLEQWRLDCHKKIDHFFEEKYHELEQIITTKKEKQQEHIFQIQSKIDKLIRDQEATRQDIDMLTLTIHQLEQEMDKIEQTHLTINTHPIFIDNALVQIEYICTKEFDAAALSTIHKSIAYPTKSRRVFCSNDRFLLINQAPNLCFVNTELSIIKQVLWPYETIEDMCWSSVLNRFIVVVRKNIFLIDEDTMNIEKLDTVEKRNWLSCSCFNEQLFLLVNAWGSSIIEAKLFPSITIIKEWKPPITCTMDEIIHDTVYHNETLAVLIRNTIDKSIRMELRSSKTLDCLWSLALDVTFKDLTFRCCSLTYNNWLVVDYNTGRLLHISADGKIIERIPYEEIPFRVTLFRSNMLAIATENKINFHKL